LKNLDLYAEEIVVEAAPPADQNRRFARRMRKMKKSKKKQKK
jgi:hypothetical protein